jgi:small conductance mechanosensitive channel
MIMSTSDFTVGWNEISGLGFSMDPSAFLAALVVLVVAWSLNKLSNRMVERAVERRSGHQHAEFTAKKATSYVIYTISGFAILGVFGVPLSALGTFLGLIGLGISFALRDTIANLIAGLMIMVNQPFKVGDQIETQGEEGTVKDIRIRATEIRTYDGKLVIIPNSQLYNGVVINNTAYDERRFDLIVGVGYEDDMQTAKDLAEETLDEIDEIEDEPEPEVLVEELGGSSVNLKLRGWTRPSKANMVAVTSEATQKIKEKYDDEGIDIPYPIRTVYLNEK